MSAGFRLALFRRIEEVQENVAFVRFESVGMVPAFVVAPHEDVAAGLFERFGEAHAVGFCGNHGVGAAENQGGHTLKIPCLRQKCPSWNIPSF